jgi:hypothetical protein
MLKIAAGRGSLLFKMDIDGFGSLPRSIPTVWVTAPTEESSDLVFAINGPFPLDVGRAKLGRDSREYAATAHDIGLELVQRLCELYDLANKDWTGFAKTMRLASDLDAYDFWLSFWGLSVEPFAHRRHDKSNEAIVLAHEILWHASDTRCGVVCGLVARTMKDSIVSGPFQGHRQHPGCCISTPPPATLICA